MVQAFGKKTVTTGGTPTQCSTASARVGLQSVLFQALPSNTGLVYVLCKPNRLGSPGDDRTNLTYCVAILGAPTSATAPPPSASFSMPNAADSFDLRDFWVDVSVNGNGVVVSGTHSQSDSALS